jgi:hypothetical protein
MADEPKINIVREYYLGLQRLLSLAPKAFELGVSCIKRLPTFLIGVDNLIKLILYPIRALPQFRRNYPWITLIIVAYISVSFTNWFFSITEPNQAIKEFFSFQFWKNEKSEINRSEVFRNLSLAVIAMVGLSFGIWRAWTAYRQTEIAEQGMFTERFSKATEQLGSEQLPVRLGGIYSLWRLAEDSGEKDAKSVFDILCAFIRKPTRDQNFPEQSLEVKEEADKEETEPPQKKEIICRPDVQAILELIGNPDLRQRSALPRNYEMNLRGADLRKANMYKQNLNNINLANGHLEMANLSFSSLENANLLFAHMENALLSFANLKGADFSFADLKKANLLSANLENADLSFVQLENAEFTGTHLEKSRLSYAHLENVDLSEAHLEGADFFKAKTKGVNWPDGFSPPDDVDDSIDDEDPEGDKT